MSKSHVSMSELKLAYGQIIEETYGNFLFEGGAEEREGSEAMQSCLEAVESIADVIDFLEAHGVNAEEWLDNLDLEFPVSEGDYRGSTAIQRVDGS